MEGIVPLKEQPFIENETKVDNPNISIGIDDSEKSFSLKLISVIDVNNDNSDGKLPTRLLLAGDKRETER